MDHCQPHFSARSLRIPPAVGRGLGRLVARPGPPAMAMLILGLMLIIAADGQISTQWRQLGLSVLLVLDIVVIGWLIRSHDGQNTPTLRR